MEKIPTPSALPSPEVQPSAFPYPWFFLFCFPSPSLQKSLPELRLLKWAFRHEFPHQMQVASIWRSQFLLHQHLSHENPVYAFKAAGPLFFFFLPKWQIMYLKNIILDTVLKSYIWIFNTKLILYKLNITCSYTQLLSPPQNSHKTLKKHVWYYFFVKIFYNF